mmetsp:Transcript_41045/g.76338  ORF Transcript_41045/g.76338 Transcript_41045/m.76338 type:complete len:193 (-) Transcript_41045:38-616(-)
MLARGLIRWLPTILSGSLTAGLLVWILVEAAVEDIQHPIWAQVLAILLVISGLSITSYYCRSVSLCSSNALTPQLDPGLEGQKIFFWAQCEFGCLKSGMPPLQCFQLRRGQGTSAFVETLPLPGAPQMPAPCLAPAVENESCVCCLAPFVEDCQVAILPCGHIFHERCIAAWSLCEANTCPACKRNYSLVEA